MRAARHKEVVVVGGSQGALQPLTTILHCLKPDSELAIAVVLHQHRHGGIYLPDLLSRKVGRPVLPVWDDLDMQPGRIYVGPADYHLLIERGGTFALSTDEPVHHSRPAIDVLFESAARAYGASLVGVLLSGASEDGAAGLRAIKAAGGSVACQDPATAEAPTMPEAGTAATQADLVRPAEEIGKWLATLRS